MPWARSVRCITALIMITAVLYVHPNVNDICCVVTESISRYSLQIQTPLESSVVQEDDPAEKGETDSFCQENILSDGEKNRIFISKRYTDLCNSRTKELWASDLDERIQSVTVHDSGRARTNIVIERTGERSNVKVWVGTSHSRMTFEISAAEPAADTDVKAVLVFRNEQENERLQRRSFGQTSDIDGTERKDSESNLSSVSSQDDGECCKSCCKDHGEHCGGENMDADGTPADESSACSSPSGEISLSDPFQYLINDVFWDIPVPIEFADQQPDPDLTEDIEPEPIDDPYVFKEERGSRYGPGLDGLSWKIRSKEELRLESLITSSRIAFSNILLNTDSQENDLNAKKVSRRSRELLCHRRRTFPSDQALHKGAFLFGTHLASCEVVVVPGSNPEHHVRCLLKNASGKLSSRKNVVPRTSPISGADTTMEYNPSVSEDVVDCNPTTKARATKEDLIEMEDDAKELDAIDAHKDLLLCASPAAVSVSPSPGDSIQTDNVGVGAQTNRRCSVVTIIREEYEQRVLWNNSASENEVLKDQPVAETSGQEAQTTLQSTTVPSDLICSLKERNQPLVVNQSSSVDGQTNSKRE